MLEESAAQLAALRQRAEFILEQLASDSPPSRESQDGVSPQAKVTIEDQQGPALHLDPTDRTGPENALQPERSVIDGALPDAQDANPGWTETDGHTPESHLQSQPSPQQYALSSSEEASQSRNRDQAPRETEPPAEENMLFSLSGAAPTDQPEPQEQRFPIQSVQPQRESLLDNPVTVAPPPEWLKFEVAPEFLSSDAQLIEEEIAVLYEAIERFRETRRENTGHALSLLREAREIISGQPHRIERAQYNIQQVRQIIERAKSSRSRSLGIALRTFGLLILWLAALGGLGAALFLYPLEVNEIILLISSSTGWNTSHYQSLLWTVAAGGIGGCLGTISFLFERMRIHEEFDHQYILRSMIQPLMGIILGLITYGLLVVLFNSLNASIIGHSVTSYLPAALALPVGLWQVYVYAAIFRFTRLLSFQRRRRW